MQEEHDYQMETALVTKGRVQNHPRVYADSNDLHFR